MIRHADLLPRYQHLRQMAMQLNHRLVETLRKDVLDEGGKKLGILKKKVLVLDSEDEIAVLMDYCIYDVWRGGLNAIERYLATSPPAPGSDEMVLLDAMRQAWYTLVVIESAERGVGVHVRDLLRDEPLFLTDVGFSMTARPGLIMATRIIAPEGICMTTGAALPVVAVPLTEGGTLLDQLMTAFKVSSPQQMSPQQASAFATSVIRQCLRHGAAERIQYGEPKDAPKRGPDRRDSLALRRPGRNDPCPCGSGRKFRKCCGTRR